MALKGFDKRTNGAEGKGKEFARDSKRNEKTKDTMGALLLTSANKTECVQVEP